MSVDTLRRGEDGRIELKRSKGRQRLVPLREVQRLLAERRRPQRTMTAQSARNQLEAVVTEVVRAAAAATVQLQAGPFRLLALVTAESVDELGLEPGTGVMASIKSRAEPGSFHGARQPPQTRERLPLRSSDRRCSDREPAGDGRREPMVTGIDIAQQYWGESAFDN